MLDFDCKNILFVIVTIVVIVVAESTDWKAVIYVDVAAPTAKSFVRRIIRERRRRHDSTSVDTAGAWDNVRR